MPLSFEQQPKESAKAFAAFREYLELGSERSCAAVGKKLGKSAALIERWSAKYDWADRVQAHGAHWAIVEREVEEALTKAKAVEWVKRKEEQRDEEWKVRCELLEAGREALRRWKKDERRCGSLEGIARLFELASKLGRLAAGMATEKTEVTGEDGEPIRIEVSAALDKIYGKPVPGEVVEVEEIETPKLPEKV